MLSLISIAYATSESNGINYLSYFGNLIFFFIIFIGIILLALYVTKFIGKKTNHLGKGKNLTVLDFVNLSGNVKIITVKIYKKVYILSISNNNTTVIDRLDEDELELDFEDYLNQNLNNNQFKANDYVNKFKEKIINKINDSPKDKE